MVELGLILEVLVELVSVDGYILLQATLGQIVAEAGGGQRLSLDLRLRVVQSSLVLGRVLLPCTYHIRR